MKAVHAAMRVHEAIDDLVEALRERRGVLVSGLISDDTRGRLVLVDRLLEDVKTFQDLSTLIDYIKRDL